MKRRQFETSQGDVKTISTGHLSSNSIIEKKEQSIDASVGTQKRYSQNISPSINQKATAELHACLREDSTGKMPKQASLADPARRRASVELMMQHRVFKVFDSELEPALSSSQRTDSAFNLRSVTRSGDLLVEKAKRSQEQQDDENKVKVSFDVPEKKVVVKPPSNSASVINVIGPPNHEQPPPSIPFDLKRFKNTCNPLQSQ